MAGAQVLGGKVGDAVANGGERCDHQVIELYGSSVAGGNADAKAVDAALDHHVSQGDEGLLQDAGNSNDGDPFKQGPGKAGGRLLGFDLGEASDYEDEGEDAADALTEKGCPCDSGYPHGEGFYK